MLFTPSCLHDVLKTLSVANVAGVFSFFHVSVCVKQNPFSADLRPVDANAFAHFALRQFWCVVLWSIFPFNIGFTIYITLVSITIQSAKKHFSRPSLIVIAATVDLLPPILPLPPTRPERYAATS